MKTIPKLTIVLACVLAISQQSHAQGFINLNFENPILPLSPNGIDYPTANTIPGWTAYINGNQQTSIGYNAISLGGAIVSLNDTNASAAGALSPIQGKYSVYFNGSFLGIPFSAAIGQTGQVPISTQSLTFWAAGGGFQVSFNGQPISYLVTGNTANYTMYAADISAYAGQTGELLFTTPYRTDMLLDNIQFSSTAVPEPGTLALIALGGASLALKLRKKYGNQSRP